MPITYPLDLTGTALSNRIQNENRVFTAPEDRMFMLQASPFYTQGLQIYRQPGNVLLQPGTHYKALWLDKGAVMESGKEVCAVLYVFDDDTNEVNINYQTIGGPYTTNTSAIQQALDTLALPDANQVSWGQLLNVPAQFPPVEHLHHTRNIFGFQELTAQLEAIRMAMVNDGDAGVIAAIFQYIDNRINNDTLGQSDLTDLNAAIIAAITQHKAEANPHTKTQIGLGSVENYPVPTDGEALTGTATNRYQTVAQTVKTIHGALRNNLATTNAAYDPNTSMLPIYVSSNVNCPNGADGVADNQRYLIITVFRVTDPAATNATSANRYQMAINVNSENSNAGIWVREYWGNTTSWDPWTRIDNADWKEIGSANLDTFTYAGGFSKVTAYSTVNAVDRNYPNVNWTNVQFALEVHKTINGHLIQDVRTLNSTPAEHYRRFYNGTSWGAWANMFDKANMGLSNVLNNPIASEAEALDGLATDRMTTVQRAAQAALGVLRDHTAGNVDPNTVLAPYILTTHAGCPISTVPFIVWTLFDPALTTDANSTTTPRQQIAFAVTTDGKESYGVFHRFYNGTAPYANGNWTPWRRFSNTNYIDDVGGVSKRYTYNNATPTIRPDNILDPFFRFTFTQSDVTNFGDVGGVGLIFGAWYIQTYFDNSTLGTTTNTYRTQIAFLQNDNEQAKNNFYVRRCGTDGIWTRWTRMGAGAEPLLMRDLNLVQQDGLYVQWGSLSLAEYNDRNYPINKNGFLVVMDPYTQLYSGGVLQTYYVVSANGSDLRAWVRSATNATVAASYQDVTWGPWIQFRDADGRNTLPVRVQEIADITGMSTGDVIRWSGTVWEKRTLAQLKSDLNLNGVSNYGDASAGEGYQGTAANKFTTPQTARFAALGAVRDPGVTNQDPNTVLDPFIITTHANAPVSSGVFLIYTMFMPALATDINETTNRRHQVAMGLSGVNGVYRRYHDGTNWGTWSILDNAINTAGASYTTASTAPNNSPNTCLDPVFIFSFENAGEGGTGLPLFAVAGSTNTSWVIQNIFLSTTLTINSSSPRIQFAYANTNVLDNHKNRVYMRRYSGSAWSTWWRVDSNGGRELTAADDLNTITDDGWYTSRDGSASTVLNYPAVVNGNLLVIDSPTNTGLNGGIRQIYYSNGDFSIWMRRYTGSAWTAWYRLEDAVADPYKDHPIMQALRRARVCTPINFNGNLTTVITPAVNNNLTGISNFSKPILGLDGKVYGIKMGYNYGTGSDPVLRMAVYDPKTDDFEVRTTTIAGISSPDNGVQQFGCVVSSHGSRIYFIPMNLNSSVNGKIPYYDIVADTYGFLDIPTDALGPQGWYAAAMSPIANRLYLPPYKGNRVLRITTGDNVAPTYVDDPLPVSVTDAYRTAQLGLDGKIYCLPYNADDIMIIDPVTDTYELTTMGLGIDIANLGDDKFIGAVMGSDGVIYGIPYGSEKILAIDTYTQTARLINAAGAVVGGSNWGDGCIGPDGRIYASPFTKSGALIIDTSVVGAPSVSNIFTSVFVADLQVQGLVQLPNGSLFGFTTDDRYITLEHHKAMPLGMDILLSPYYAR